MLHVLPLSLTLPETNIAPEYVSLEEEMHVQIINVGLNFPGYTSSFSEEQPGDPQMKEK